MIHTESILEKAGNWFLSSGIQDTRGGVARYYRSDLGENALVSTEITGYSVSALIYLHSATGDARYRDAAVRSARFLTENAWDSSCGTFPFEHSVNGAQPLARAYFFDCGIIVRGLIAAWRATGEAAFLHRAEQAGRAMLADFRAHDRIHPILTLPSKEPVPCEPKWSASPGCYQLKSALAWLDLFEATGDESFRRAYEETLQQALGTEAEFLPGSGDREKVMDRLHAYSYFLEALIPRVDRPECAAALRRGIERAGGFLDSIAPSFERSDVNAQLLRVRLWAHQLGVVPLDAEAATHEACRTAYYQAHSSDARIDGGFMFGSKGPAMLPYVNPVSTAFALQALNMWNEHSTSGLTTRWQALI